MNLIDKLTGMKERIEQTKISKAQLEGKLQSTKEGMKKDYGFSSSEEARERIKKIDKKISIADKKLKEKIAELGDVEW